MWMSCFLCRPAVTRVAIHFSCPVFIIVSTGWRFPDARMYVVRWLNSMEKSFGSARNRKTSVAVDSLRSCSMSWRSCWPNERHSCSKTFLNQLNQIEYPNLLVREMIDVERMDAFRSASTKRKALRFLCERSGFRLSHVDRRSLRFLSSRCPRNKSRRSFVISWLSYACILSQSSIDRSRMIFFFAFTVVSRVISLQISGKFNERWWK